MIRKCKSNICVGDCEHVCPNFEYRRGGSLVAKDYFQNLRKSAKWSVKIFEEWQSARPNKAAMNESLGFDYANVASALKLMDDKFCGRNWENVPVVGTFQATLYQMVCEIIDIYVTRMVQMTHTCWRGVTEGKCNNSVRQLINYKIHILYILFGQLIGICLPL